MTEERFVRVGRNVYGYGGWNVHPGAIVRYRPDQVGNRKMQEHHQLSEPFQEDASAFVTCSDAFCQGVYMLADSGAEWEQHVQYAHSPKPNSRIVQLQRTFAAKIAAHDQAVEAEREAAERKAELQGEVDAIRAEVEAIEQPEPVKVKAAKAQA